MKLAAHVISELKPLIFSSKVFTGDAEREEFWTFSNKSGRAEAAVFEAALIEKRIPYRRDDNYYTISFKVGFRP